jgi:DNA-directed RNA polymerase specialized sigma24 family protein
MDGSLNDLLKQTHYNPHTAEAVLEHYLRIYQPMIQTLLDMGADYEDVVQELRIALWQAWVRWDGRLTLRRWLSWKTRYVLMEYKRALAKQNRLRTVSIDAPLEPE